MRFGVFLPPQAAQRHGAGAALPGGPHLHRGDLRDQGRRAARAPRELGLMLVTPDTSPRGAGVPGADADWDFGIGAGFYLDATQAPWRAALAHGELIVDGAAAAAGRALSRRRRAPAASSATRWAATAR